MQGFQATPSPQTRLHAIPESDSQSAGLMNSGSVERQRPHITQLENQATACSNQGLQGRTRVQPPGARKHIKLHETVGD